MALIHLLSIFLEVGVALLGLKLVRKKKIYGWGIFTTFGIYVIYDLAKFFSLPISTDLLYLLFFVASASAFWAVWEITQKK